jgi:hypothetical protein
LGKVAQQPLDFKIDILTQQTEMIPIFQHLLEKLFGVLWKM